MNESLLLVLGGTGSIGRRVATTLSASGRSVRAASRHGPARFDWADPSTWAAAVAAVAAVALVEEGHVG
ncbi:hypothetical protein [Haloactinopolyspora sp.]|uniref:hypothetical protein n=1 Tax=Haloactinopolyspora sp. TaxID=1966353 RepID=UPI00260C8541|nr:hypothetical protein [Haloactinopolyspora sp.]